MLLLRTRPKRVKSLICRSLLFFNSNIMMKRKTMGWRIIQQNGNVYKIGLEKIDKWIYFPISIIVFLRRKYVLREFIWIVKDTSKFGLFILSPFLFSLMMIWLHSKVGSLSMAIGCFFIAFLAAIWCILIIRDPTLTKEEKWKRLWGKYQPSHTIIGINGPQFAGFFYRGFMSELGSLAIQLGLNTAGFNQKLTHVEQRER